ncbi:MAG: hypothetical protein HRT51_02175 [Colwellia sp.]|nr:hypothetical protein [Colwellia sp.]
MANDPKQSLEQINELSRQLLSLILDVQNKIQENTIIINESNSNQSITEDALTELMSKRDKLIRFLFKQKTTDEIEQELTLLNEMVLLDSKLSSELQACKQILSDQVIRLKKRKKVAKSYQQY